MAQFLILRVIPGASDEGFPDEHIQGIDAVLRGMRFQPFTEFLSSGPGDEVKHAAAENDVIFHIRIISLEKSHAYFVVLRKPFRLFNPLFGDIESGHGVSAFRQKDRVLPLPAADVQHPVGLYGGKNLHDIIADAVGQKPPVILFRLVPPVIVRHHAPVAQQGVHCGVERCRQLRQHFDVGVGRIVLPFRDRLE